MTFKFNCIENWFCNIWIGIVCPIKAYYGITVNKPYLIYKQRSYVSTRRQFYGDQCTNIKQGTAFYNEQIPNHILQRCIGRVIVRMWNKKKTFARVFINIINKNDIKKIKKWNDKYFMYSPQKSTTIDQPDREIVVGHASGII